MDSLLTLNFGAFGLHLLLLVALIAYYYIKTPKKTSVTLFKNKTSSFEGDDACDKCNCWPEKGLTSDMEIDLFWLTAAFTAVTALAHLAYATNGFGTGFYLKSIKNGSNPLRWLEYGVSASCMAVILAVLSGIRLRNYIIIIFLATFAQMLQGYNIEASVARGNAKSLESAIPLIAGWVLLIAVWFGTFDEWYSAFSDFKSRKSECISDNCVTTSEEGEPPKFIEHLITVVFVLFASFGLVNIAHVINGSRGTVNFRNYERAYIILSFVSKALLIIWSLSSVFNGELEWLQACATEDTCSCIPIV